MQAIKDAKLVTIETLNHAGYRTYPLLIQALVEGELVSMTVKPEGNIWNGDAKAVGEAKEIYGRLYDDTYLDDDHTYVFRLAEDGIVLVAIYDETGKENMVQLITLGSTGEFVTPKLYPASLIPKDALGLAKIDGAKGLSIHFFDGTVQTLKVE